MNKKYLVAATLITSSLLARPAYADIRTFTGDDKFLYLNESMAKFPEHSLLSGWSASGVGVASPQQAAGSQTRGVSALSGDIFVSQGPFRITNERFLELLTEAKVAPDFVAKYRGHHQRPNMLWPTVLSVGIGGLGGGLTYFGSTGYNPPLMWTGIGLIAAGGLGALYSGYLYFMNPSGNPVLDPSEAYSAIQTYNKKLDSQSQ